MSAASMISDVMELMRLGAVTLRLHDPASSRDPTERTEVPFVSVTAGGKTWAQPIRRSINSTDSSPDQIAEALAVALDRVSKEHRPTPAVYTKEGEQ